MAFVREYSNKASAQGYVTASSYNDAHDVLSVISSTLDTYSTYDVQEEEPSYLYDDRAYKVTITVERLQ